MSGISFTQTAQSVAQNLTITTLPTRSRAAMRSPCSETKVTSGAGCGCPQPPSDRHAARTARMRPRGRGTMRRILSGLALLVISTHAAAGLEDITQTEAVRALRQALNDGSLAAVAKLGVENGFFGNSKVRIPLPPSLQKVERGLRAFGMKREADELVLAMNRAAEAAVPEAKALLTDAVRKMTVQDAKKILSGGDTAATDYFRRSTEKQLTQRFLPVVKRATDRVDLAQKYNAVAGRGLALGLIEEEEASIERYVTDKALDGLYFMIGEQEKAFRKDPVRASSDIVRRVFGAMR